MPPQLKCTIYSAENVAQNFRNHKISLEILESEITAIPEAEYPNFKIFMFLKMQIEKSDRILENDFVFGDF